MGEKLILLCNCGWKRLDELDGMNDLLELKNDTLSSRKFRCPCCGFAVTPRRVKDPQLDVDRIKKEIEIGEENKKWLEDSMEIQNKFMKELRDAEENNDQ
jgi:hypothetical protein